MTEDQLVNFLKFKRKELGFKQIIVCNRLNKHHSWISKIETRHQRLLAIELIQLCKIYEININL